MPDTSALEPGTVVAGRYRVAEKIGHGGMGAVYLVHHVHTDESLALKVLHPQVLRDASAVERFRREARTPARITSEHVARVTDADTAPDLDGAPFYVMELLRGQDLEKKLATDGPLPPSDIIEYLRQAGRALDKAHAIGIVHRDLKPENLFLTHREDGSPCIKLLDFGIARLADSDGPTKISTQVGYVFGTPNYMAPEQTLGEPDKIGPATDVWAIGLIAFKLLVGREYFPGTNVQALYAQVLVEPLTPPSARGSTHGPEFDAWFARCVARSIPERFASVGEAVTALARAFGIVLAERHSSAEFPDMLRASQSKLAVAATELPAAVSTTVPVTNLPSGGPSSKGSRGTLLAVFAGGVLLLAVGAGVAYVLRGRPPEAQGIVPVAAASRGAHPLEATAKTEAPPASEVPSAEPPLAEAAPSSTSAPAGTHHARGKAAPPKAGPAPGPAPAAGPAPAPATKENAPVSREQKKRLDALERLCSQGTYTPAECQSKRAAIIQGGH